jgi:hypothetical protein
MQLDGTLRSALAQCRDAAAVRWYVLYATSSGEQEGYYHTLARAHPDVHFVREEDFRADLIRLVETAERVLFVVDDAVFVRPFSIREILDALEAQPDALGCSLRLGRNTTQCYPLNQPQSLPEFTAIGGGLLKFTWTTGQHDFAYPLEVSSSVYRVADLRALLENPAIRNPNSLEALLDQGKEAFRATHPALLCSEASIAFCVPANMTQTGFHNRFAANVRYSVPSFARKFALGYRLDVERLSGFTPTGCHQEVALTFLPPPIEWERLEATLQLTAWPQNSVPPLEQVSRTGLLARASLSPADWAALLELLEALRSGEAEKDGPAWLLRCARALARGREIEIEGAESILALLQRRLEDLEAEPRKRAEYERWLETQMKNWQGQAEHLQADMAQMQGQLELERARADQGEAQSRSLAEELRYWRARAEDLDRRRLSQRLRRVWRRLRGVVTRPQTR